MTDWLSQYSAALDQRDAREQVHKPYIDACKLPSHISTDRRGALILKNIDTKLADRTASQPLVPPEPLSPQPSTGKERAGTPSKKAAQEDPNDLLTRLRADLASTQKARQTLQSSLTDLTTQLTDLQLLQRTSQSQITALTRQKTDLERRVRDREEEIRLKAKLVEDAQDEQVALGLQLNMAEEKSGKLERENKELVERWMRRMGEEAERVNRDAGWE